MNVSERTKNLVAPGILIKDIDTEKQIDIDGFPALIIRKGEREFLIWDLVPKFSKDRKPICLIVKASSNSDYSFAEPCAGIRYSENGEVIEPGFPLALPMEKYNWSIKGEYLVISKNT